jgi:hypothetical protein
LPLPKKTLAKANVPKAEFVGVGDMNWHEDASRHGAVKGTLTEETLYGTMTVFSSH